MKRLMGVHLVLSLTLLLALGLLAGPALAASTYSGGDNGKTITVGNGESFTVRLAENPTTGYSWNMTVGNGLQIVSDRYIPNSTAPNLVGSGGYHEWTIKAVSNGNSQVSGIYKRPWEPATGSEERFTLAVKVVTGGAKLPPLTPSAFKFDMPSFKTVKMPSFPGFGGMFGHFPKLNLLK